MSGDSLFHMKITVSVTKSLHQGPGRWYMHLPILRIDFSMNHKCNTTLIVCTMLV